MTGIIVKLLPDANAGFILRDDDGRRVYFSAGESHDFDGMCAGDRVSFSDDLYDLFGNGKKRVIDVRKYVQS